MFNSKLLTLLTQLYRYTPEIFLCSTATFKYTYRANWTRISRIFSERRLIYFSVIETDTATFGLRWIFHVHSELSRPGMCNNAIMTISFKYTYRANWTRIFSERLLVYFSVIETDTATSGLV
jgi:uncharacterized membrane protein